MTVVCKHSSVDLLSPQGNPLYGRNAYWESPVMGAYAGAQCQYSSEDLIRLCCQGMAQNIATVDLALNTGDYVKYINIEIPQANTMKYGRCEGMYIEILIARMSLW